MTILCHCGEPLHYGSKEVEKQINSLVEKNGRYIKVTAAYSGISYKVDRHFIALHGLKGSDLATSGFEVWLDETA